MSLKYVDHCTFDKAVSKILSPIVDIATRKSRQTVYISAGIELIEFIADIIYNLTLPRQPQCCLCHCTMMNTLWLHLTESPLS